MLPIATKQSGGCDASPDTCLTPAPPGPPAPVGYPNHGELMQGNPGTCSTRVKALNQPVMMQGSQIMMTSGDEAGVNGGVMSGTFKGPAEFKKGSAKVKVEGKPLAFQTCTTGHNGASANAPMGVHSSPSQSKVFVAS